LTSQLRIPPREISPYFLRACLFIFGRMVATTLSVFSAFTRDVSQATEETAKNMSSGDKAANRERTFIAVKPDGVQRGLVGEITKRFEQRGYKLVAAKLCRPGKEHLEKHYADLSSKGFFAGLCNYMNSGPIFAMVWEGKGVVKMGRQMLGATNPFDSLPGTIRGDFCIEVGRNICHGSDAVESAEKEISLWFKPEELISYDSCAKDWVYE